ncbi:MAG: hypothetical protein RMJ51_06955, partial [Candidatus Calescibacterium sp.]|nr:hypothetical protein [Candidatus Calescibacterium sp.]MDW8195948.1 hypothetical protein [Candidatus Calescibacterium sp.]
NNKTLTTNDGKQMGLNEGMVNVGTNGQNNNTNAVTVDVDRTGNQSKDNNNRLEPASSPNLGSSDSSSSSNASNTSNTSNASSSGAGER